MRYITALSFLALFATGCGPTNTNPSDTGRLDTDADADSDADSDTDADTGTGTFEATALADVFDEMTSPALSVPGATCSGDECVINKPGEYVGTLTVSGWTILPQTFTTEEDGEIVTLPFTNEGQSMITLTNGTYTGSETDPDEHCRAYDATVTVSVTTSISIRLSSVPFDMVPTGSTFYGHDDDRGTMSGTILSANSFIFVAEPNSGDNFECVLTLQ